MTRIRTSINRRPTLALAALLALGAVLPIAADLARSVPRPNERPGYAPDVITHWGPIPVTTHWSPVPKRQVSQVDQFHDR